MCDDCEYINGKGGPTCPCVHFDASEGDPNTCECGHVEDEHDQANGGCTVVLDPD